MTGQSCLVIKCGIVQMRKSKTTKLTSGSARADKAAGAIEFIPDAGETECRFALEELNPILKELGWKAVERKTGRVVGVI